MNNSRSFRMNLACAMGALLIVAMSVRTVEAIPLTSTVLDLATICASFDCAAAVTSSETYSISPAPDPDGTLQSFALPGVAPDVAGTFLYGYQLIQDTASTAVIDSLIVPFEGLFGSPFSFVCSDCEGTEAPTLADFVSGPDAITFSLAGLLSGQSSLLFGAISTAGPQLALVGVSANGSGADVLALAPAATAVPEPASLMLLGSGIAGLAAARRRKQQRQN